MSESEKFDWNPGATRGQREPPQVLFERHLVTCEDCAEARIEPMDPDALCGEGERLFSDWTAGMSPATRAAVNAAMDSLGLGATQDEAWGAAVHAYRVGASRVPVPTEPLTDEARGASPAVRKLAPWVCEGATDGVHVCVGDQCTRCGKTVPGQVAPWPTETGAAPREAAPDVLREAAQFVVNARERTGECDECGAEVCRGGPHTAGCDIGALRAALRKGAF